MRISFKRFTIVLLVLVLVAVPWCAMASSGMVTTDYQVTVAAMAGDAIVVRPLGIASVVLGFGLFIVSSPFSALGGNIGDAWSTLVDRPARFTFVRPLGEFDGAGGL